MKRISARLLVLIAGVALFASCLGDDDDKSSVYGDTAIVQFTLGTMNRYTNTTSSTTGNDTVIKSTLSGSTYKMTIDQLAGNIYNVKELPVGTDVKHVVCTVVTKNSGVVALQSMTSDSLKWFSSTDSIDFSQPRRFRVFSSDGTNTRDYIVQLNVSSTTGINFGWKLVKSDEALAGWTDKKLVATGDTVLLADRDSIIGVSTNECYAMLGPDLQMMCSRDNGNSWNREVLDDDVTLLPAADKAEIVSWPYFPADNTDYVLMVGAPRQEDVQSMRVWRKIAPYAGGGQWVYMPVDDGNHYPLPRMEHLSLAYYDGTVLALGSDMQVWQSRDQGITWRINSTFALPEALTGTQAIMTSDSQQRLWLLTNTGQLWQGYASK